MIRTLLWTVLLFFIFGCTHSNQAVSQDSPPQHPLDSSQQTTYPWIKNYALENTLVNRIPLPRGYERLAVEDHSFANWLRHIPLKPGRPPVYLFNGNLKYNQQVHAAVVDIDVGKKDLQQCADAVMRLRGEYLYSENKFDSLHFNFTNGFNCDYNHWSQGFRPILNDNQVTWKSGHPVSTEYASFREYMNKVFMYAGTQSLSREMKSKHIKEIQGGDVFIRGGFPGHAVLVMDVAVNKITRKRVYLLAQSYMPAQDIHLLINPEDPHLSPWYSNDVQDDVVTPEWKFVKDELRKF